MVNAVRFQGNFAIHGPLSKVREASSLIREQLARNGEVYVVHGPVTPTELKETTTRYYFGYAVRTVRESDPYSTVWFLTRADAIRHTFRHVLNCMQNALEKLRRGDLTFYNYRDETDELRKKLPRQLKHTQDFRIAVSPFYMHPASEVIQNIKAFNLDTGDFSPPTGEPQIMRMTELSHLLSKS